ncbi:outer membrane beta-barrel protein [Maritimibacter sp. UBA3975]|mgnify:CR=1 FL=1|uniref:outer membrane protein n=1 Tax=Maritimibacter sp. UBA3975 TaxID=1946833 RepID=UPI000C09A5CF|nr:outer membrane beta-barrel protein [Maritimibacter sp. UBA3975]MAM61216.1 hypothetical protein [Maritimibacter sp.]|tara:strand:+ start:12868 stop:13335 length:468 start_codon:yes stop_codon:yes gene_type:complete
MNRYIKTTALGLGLALGATAASAQDFDGFYLGAYGSGDFFSGPNTYGFGAQAGYMYEFSPGGYVGVEADAYFPMGNPNIYTGNLRLGYDFGSPVMLYGKVGAGADSTGTTLYTLGAGAEYAMGNGASLRLGMDRYQSFAGGPANYVAKAGLAYTF